MLRIEGGIIAVFCLIHLFAGKLRVLERVPRSRWLSFAGGVSVAYVFLVLFPEIAEIQVSLESHSPIALSSEHQAYLLALVGLSVFYGAERLVKGRKDGHEQPGEHKQGVFFMHLGVFALYNALVGYLLVHRESAEVQSLVFYGLAMGLHFLVNDYGMRKIHAHRYHQLGRWILAIAIVAGWLAGLALEESSALVHGLFAFLAGSTILNVLKEELPEERESRFIPFAAGVVLFTLLVIFSAG
ncbi:hypothetical protein OCL06_13400 [Alteromonas sp. ASW11-19]|uniref:Uncharacterized protein n=1 Tax=Alteromonas salexigens TaxID=2982530 RepID=A0ABT2VR29_9ALTE|nr:hypothetical protein [Alteromonas salexigens]MCU7555585.1 hypothetical protein [Alteromonas salexigens]